MNSLVFVFIASAFLGVALFVLGRLVFLEVQEARLVQQIVRTHFREHCAKAVADTERDDGARAAFISQVFIRTIEQGLPRFYLSAPVGKRKRLRSLWEKYKRHNCSAVEMSNKEQKELNLSFLRKLLSFFSEETELDRLLK